jgi:pimeloyl-ACP methyl ester carboxylesterase
MMSPLLQRFQSLSRTSVAALAVVSTATAVATWVAYRARRAGRDDPAQGQFIKIDGVRLHYVDRGQGPAVVLIHGSNVWWRDFLASGLIDVLARNHRVIIFDRPGFGHSERPRDRLWTPTAQARVIASAMFTLGLGRAGVVGHSMGSLVALALALDHPDQVRSLALVSGYHFPTLRLDALVAAPVALPVLGDVMRYTVTALSARALLNGMVKQMFAPHDVPLNFMPVLSREMLLRPIQLRAHAEDAAFMMSAARDLSERLNDLRVPVTIIAGDRDAIVDMPAHSRRLHEALPGSRLVVVEGAGHMVHYQAQQQIAEAVSAYAAAHPWGYGHAVNDRPGDGTMPELALAAV